MIDTPGHVDFTIEVERSVRVIDGAVIIVDAVSGVQAQTKTVWRQAQKHKLPAVAFVNKMDRDGASFARTLESIRSKLGANVVALQQPIFASGGAGPVVGVVDLLTLSTTIWGDGEGGSGAGGPRSPARGTVSPLLPTDPLFPSAKEARRDLVERLVETDESLMEQYLEQGEDSVSVEQLLTAMRSACHSGALVPVMCGASLKGRGVEPLLDAVVALLPSPLDRPDRSTLTAVHKNDPSRRKALDPAATSEGALCLLALAKSWGASTSSLILSLLSSLQRHVKSCCMAMALDVMKGRQASFP
jgi:elongation factor G